MAIIVKASNPELLSEKLFNGILNGAIVNWANEEHEQISYLTYTPSKWFHKAWFRPYILKINNELQFGIVPPKSGVIQLNVYALYHSCLIEIFLYHFKDEFDTIVATPNPISIDLIQKIKI